MHVRKFHFYLPFSRMQLGLSPLSYFLKKKNAMDSRMKTFLLAKRYLCRNIKNRGKVQFVFSQ